MDTQKKLEYLADASRYDLACACGTDKFDRRRRAGDGKWLYPVSLPGGGRSILLKTLLSSACVNNCLYCPLRAGVDTPRCSLDPNEIADAFMHYVRRSGIHGLFLSSGVVRNADYTMDRLCAAAGILRRGHGYKGYIHLKIIPGASDAAVREALSLASAVSLNVEAPTARTFSRLSPAKNFDKDIVGGIRRISELTSPGGRYAGVGLTTQFVVGAADETDSELVRATFGLYRRLRLRRVYFSAYQRGLGAPDLPGERGGPAGGDVLTREHRLYQADWLIRKYGFDADEIPFRPDGNLSLDKDPKTIWAEMNPAFFPVDVNRAARRELLRVPGLGPDTVRSLMALRAGGGNIRSVEDLRRFAPRAKVAPDYVKFT